MTGQTCALPGCNKPPWRSEGCISPHLTCGNLHHQLLMAGRFKPTLPHPHQAILSRNVAGLCALPVCEKQPCWGHSWCSRKHYLLWLAEFTSSLHPDQICKFPDCTRHVFVDDNSSPAQFCGWRHKQKSVMLSALNQHHQQEQLPSMEAHPHEPALPASSIESQCCLVPSLNSLMTSLEEFAPSKIPVKNIRVVEDFYEKHPWDIFTGEGDACWLIARLKFSRKGRKLTTKDHYHWKQSGRRAKKGKYTVTYYTYMKTKGKEKEADQQHARSSYTKKEYTMESVKRYALIELVKEKPKICKDQPSKQQSAEANDVSSQDLWNALWNEYSPDLWNGDMSVDSNFLNGSQVDVFPCGEEALFPCGNEALFPLFFPPTLEDGSPLLPTTHS